MGDSIGLTPGRSHGGNLHEVAAEREAENAAAALDLYAVAPSSRTLRKQRRSAKRKVGKKRSAGAKRQLPPGFEGESPFIWNTIGLFDSPKEAGEASWSGVSLADRLMESKEEGWGRGEPGKYTTPAEQPKESGEPAGEEEDCSEDVDPEDSEDRAFIKADEESESENDCPTTEEEKTDDSSYSDSNPDDGGDSSDTVPESESSEDREKEKPKRKQKNKKRKKKKGKKKKKGERGGGPDPSDSSSETSEEDGDDPGGGGPMPPLPVGATHPTHAWTAMLFNKPPEVNKNPSPELKHGDPESKKAFRIKYLEYVAKHKTDQRSIPPMYRIPPRTVVECIEPGLLVQVCRLELPKKYRTKHPERASAVAVHRWVMGRAKLPFDLEDNEGVKKMRALTCTIDAHVGIRSVQELFIKVFEIKQKHRLRTSDEEIIKWLCYNIQPPRVKTTVMNALRIKGKKGKARRTRITTFHRLLKKLARKFYAAKEMGMETGTIKPKPKPKSQKPPPKPSTKGKGKDPDQDQKPPDKDKRKLECFHCGGEHPAFKCPTCPEDRKKWSVGQWRKFKAAGKKEAGTGNKGAGTKNPGGGEKAGFKKALKPKGKCELSAVAEKPKDAADGSPYADGTATVAGVCGFWTADGGCNKATISATFAQALKTKGVDIVEHDEWQEATLADGTRKKVISGYCIADIVLQTKAGKLNLPRTHIDILQGPESGNLLYVGQAEEARLGLSSFKAQLETLAGEINAGKRHQPVAMKAKLTPVEVTTKLQSVEGPKTVCFEPGKQPIYKRRLRLGTTVDELGWEPGLVQGDGFAYVGEKNWQALDRTKYLLEPMCQGAYITTAAISGQDLKLTGAPPPGPVKTYDIPSAVSQWLGNKNGSYICEVELDVRVLPDDNRDTVERMTKLQKVTARVIESDVAAIILGNPQMEHLAERKAERLEFKAERQGEDLQIGVRLDEVLDAARLEGMSESGLEEGGQMIKEEFQDIWRLTLGPGDYADVPPMEMKLKDPEQRLPKPYSKRHTKSEMQWWKKHIDALLKAKIIQRSNSTDLSPANLVDKFKDGIAVLDDHRMVIDLRGRNSNAIADHYHIPRLDDLWHHLAGAKCFASADATKGYNQFLLAVASRKYAGFLTPFGAFELCRVLTGWINAAPYYQRTMERVLGDLLYESVIQYLDDGLVFSKEEQGLLDGLRKYFEVHRKHNIKLHPGKFVLFAKSLTWGGRDLNADGIKPAAHRTRSIDQMPEPETLADAMSFVYGVAWFRNHLPYFAEVAAPMYDLWKDAMTGKKRKTKAIAKNIRLADLPGWQGGGRKAFHDIKVALTEAIRTAFFDPKKKTCLFGDANDDFWCLLITQCNPGDEKLPWPEQAGKHTPLLWESGRFRHAQKRWHTVSKEAFVFGEKVFDYRHWINGGRLESAFFTDHKNLLAIFDPEARPPTFTKSNHKRFDRWGDRMLTLRYSIFHIDGEENLLADLGSRWGNRFAKSKVDHHGVISPKQLLRTMIRVPAKNATKTCACHTTAETTNCAPVGGKRALWTPMPKTTKVVTHPDRDVNSEQMLPKDLGGLNNTLLSHHQSKHEGERPPGLQQGKGPLGLWKNKRGAVWIPDSAVDLQQLLYAAAHQGISGHRGKKATLQRLRQHVFWNNMDKDVEAWRQQCLQCIKLSDGSSIPRPLGTTLIAERPGEVMMMDFIDMEHTSNGLRYVLMCADKFGRIVEFVACESPTAIEATKAVLSWASRYGMPSWLISDGGSHFKNKAMRLLTEHMQMEHHITLAYCPWANGAIEIVGKELLWTARALLSELGYSATDWDFLLPLIQYILNTRERDVLGGRTPIEVMTGYKPQTALDMVLWKGTLLKDAEGHVVKRDQVEHYCVKLAAALDAMHQKLANEEAERRQKRFAKAANTKRGIQFEIGDLVMVAAWGNAAHVQRSSKLCPNWQGPYEIVEPISVSAYKVRLLGRPSKTPKPVHWSRMKRFGDASFDITEKLIRTAVNDCQKFDVEEIIGWKIGPDNAVELHVRWEGFEDEDNTWQGLQQMHEDVPALVRKYLKAHEGEDERLDDAAQRLS